MKQLQMTKLLNYGIKIRVTIVVTEKGGCQEIAIPLSVQIGNDCLGS